MKKYIVKVLLFYISLTSIALCAEVTIATPAPVITGIYLSSEKTPANQPVQLMIKATSPDKLPLYYTFECKGTVENTLSPQTIFWTPPHVAGTYTITINVSNGTAAVCTTRQVSVINTTEDILPLIKVSGNYILGPDEKKLNLRGICFANDVYNDSPDLPQTKDGIYWEPTDADYKRISLWGANSARFYLNAKWFSSPKVWDYLNKNIELAKKYDIYLILNIHYGPGETPLDKSGLWKDNQNKTAFIKIWTDIARRYKYSQVIAGYDLLNEPAPPKEADWWVLADSTLKAIRAEGDEHVIFLENTFINSTYSKLPEEKLKDNNLVYSFHFYSPNEFTHQGTSWTCLPEGVNYPYSKQVYQKYCGGEYQFPAISRSTKGQWQELDPGKTIWAKPPKDANTLILELSSNGNKGTVWFDDIKLFKKTKAGVITEIPLDNSDFSTMVSNFKPLGWTAKTSDGNKAIMELDGDVGKGQNKNSLKIAESNDWSQDNAQYAVWQHTRGLPIEAGCAYQVKGYVMADDKASGTNTIQIQWAKTSTKLFDKKVIKAELEKYIKWSQINEVPLYCGEYGVVGAAPTQDKIRWLNDINDIMDGNNSSGMIISRTYHVYRDYLGISDPEKRCDFGLLSAPEKTTAQIESLDHELSRLIFK